MLKIWNASLVLATGMLAILGTFLVRSGILDSIHAFGASTLGVPFVIAHRGDDRRLDRPRRVAARRRCARENQLDSLLSREAVFLGNNLVLVGAGVRRLLGDLLPAHLRGGHRHEASVGPPWFDQYIVPLALVLVLLSGHRAAHRVAPRDAPRTPGATCSRPALVGARGRASCCLVARRRPSPPAVAHVRARRVRDRRASARSSGAACGARRAMTGEAAPRSRCVSLVRRNRRRYGGYIVHVGHGAAVHRRRGVVGVPARARRRACKPGQSDAQSATTTSRYVRPTSSIRRRRRPPGEDLASASVLDVRARRQARHDAAPERGFFPSRRSRDFGPVGRFFEGEATSEVGLKAGLARDVWTAMTPDIDALQADHRGGRQGLREVDDDPGTTPRGAARRRSARSSSGSRESYRRSPPPATFRRHRLAARDVDLDRRDRHLPRRR